jgi:hypothetical protein
VWKRVCAYILGIPLAFFGVLYAYSWRQHQQAAEQGRKVLADLAGKYEALDSFGDIDLDPSGLTLAKLEERFHQPARTLRGAQNTVTIGWACMSEQCAIWVSFLAPPDRKLDPGAVPVALGIHDSRQIRPHLIAVGGIHLGEPIHRGRKAILQETWLRCRTRTEPNHLGQTLENRVRRDRRKGRFIGVCKSRPDERSVEAVELPSGDLGRTVLVC